MLTLSKRESGLDLLKNLEGQNYKIRLVKEFVLLVLFKSVQQSHDHLFHTTFTIPKLSLRLVSSMDFALDSDQHFVLNSQFLESI